MAHEAGKGSGRRKEDASKVRDNWDLIWGNKKQQKEQAMNEYDDEHEHDEVDHDDNEWRCDQCGGPMYKQPHWDYGQCDDCGTRERLINDDYL